MNGSGYQVGPGALVFIGVYLFGMIGIGWLGRMHRREDSLRDFYLGGSTLGFGVLFLTLFATQYSGNTLLGFAGNAYRQGASYIVSVTFMILALTIILMYAPRLFRLARQFGYITPADFIYHRYGSHALRILSVFLLCWALANYVLSQLVAMGIAMEGVSGGKIGYMSGVLTLALVMLVYETLGGMRSVAWTDSIQGILLFCGCAVILFILLTGEGGLSGAGQIIQQAQPEKLTSPDWPGIRGWIGTLMVLGLGIPLYPHAIQRVYAARNLRVLRHSIALMVFMPMVTTLLAFLIGYIGLSRIPNLASTESDKITIYMLTAIGQSAFTRCLVVVMFAAIIAAIMSTADSALLSIGSMVTKDLYKEYINPAASPRNMLLVGKVFGWALMAVLIYFAYLSHRYEWSIWKLVKLKLEFLMQLSPAFLLGLFWRRLGAGPVIVGMLVGTAIALVFWGGVTFGGWDETWLSPWGIKAGAWGVAANFAICVGGGLISRDGAGAGDRFSAGAP